MWNPYKKDLISYLLEQTQRLLQPCYGGVWGTLNAPQESRQNLDEADWNVALI